MITLSRRQALALGGGALLAPSALLPSTVRSTLR